MMCWYQQQESVFVYLKVDVRQLKYYYMEDDSGGLLVSAVHPHIKAAIIKVSHTH